MNALRQKMIEDMQLRGFAERTQEAYLLAVRQLAKHLWANHATCSSFGGSSPLRRYSIGGSIGLLEA